jgi:hypothetical protein
LAWNPSTSHVLPSGSSILKGWAIIEIKVWIGVIIVKSGREISSARWVIASVWHKKIKSMRFVTLRNYFFPQKLLKVNN